MQFKESDNLCYLNHVKLVSLYNLNILKIPQNMNITANYNY